MAKILVVEDDPQLSLTYGILLKKEGHEVDHAHNGFEALTKIKTFTPEIILLDIRMPGMDGIEFLRQVKLKENFPDVKVIVFSNMEQADQIEEAFKLGAHSTMLKSSFSPSQLADMIRQTLLIK